MTTTYKNHTFNSTNVRIRNFRQQGTRVILGALWRCAPDYTQRLVSKLFFSPARPPLLDSQKQLLAEGKAFERRLNHKTIRCWQWGQGPAILLAHGWNGRGVSLFRFIKPLVEQGYTVIAFDAPAHGESDGTTTSYFEFTDVVRAFIKPDRGFNIVGVIGHSFGAAATVNALSKERLPIPAVLIAPALKLKEVLYNTFDNYGIPKSLYQNIIAKYERTYGYHLDHDNPLRLLPTLTAPILVIHDRNDNVIPYMDSRTAVQNHIAIRFHTTTGLGHKRILVNEKVLHMTRSYLQKHHQLGSTSETKSINTQK